MNALDLPTDFEHRLWEWAHFFRDRRRLESCKSLESRYKASNDTEGWGDTDAAPSVQPRRSFRIERALQTHQELDRLDRKYKWALTYAYCYPGLPRFVVLRALKKFTGMRFTWRAYEDALDIGRIRLYTLLCGSV